MKHISIFLAASLLLGGAVHLDEATFAVGQKYYQQGLYSEAEKRFLEIVRKFPDSAKFRDSLYLLGNSYANMGNDKAALQYYKVLLNKSQTTAQKQAALLGIAKSWLQLGVYDKAAEFYSFYASEYPESEHSPGALFYAGIAREREGNTTAAVEKYRRVFELYPGSSFHGKAIEKVAVLDQNTPETLWKEPSRVAGASKAPQGLFPEEENMENIRGYTAPLPRAQSIGDQPIPAPAAAPSVITQIVPSAPTVLTQVVQAPPIILTQTVQSPPIILTQTIIAPVSAPAPAPTQEAPPRRELPRDIQAMISNKVVVISNGQVVHNSNLSSEEAAKIAEYRRQWEAERLREDQAKKIAAAAAALNQMVEVSDTKNDILRAKEASLKEKQNNLKASIASGMSNTNIVKAKPYAGAPNNTVKIGMETNVTTTIVAPPAPDPAPAAPVLEEPALDPAYPDDANYNEDYADYPNYEYDYQENGLDAEIDPEAAAEGAPLVDE